VSSCAKHSDTVPWTYLDMKYRNTALASSVLQDVQHSFSFFYSQLEGYYSPTTPASAIPCDHDVPNAVVCCWFWKPNCEGCKRETEKKEKVRNLNCYAGISLSAAGAAPSERNSLSLSLMAITMKLPDRVKREWVRTLLPSTSWISPYRNTVA